MCGVCGVCVACVACADCIDCMACRVVCVRSFQAFFSAAASALFQTAVLLYSIQCCSISLGVMPPAISCPKYFPSTQWNANPLALTNPLCAANRFSLATSMQYRFGAAAAIASKSPLNHQHKNINSEHMSVKRPKDLRPKWSE
jgi:hypothetical protein